MCDNCITIHNIPKKKSRAGVPARHDRVLVLDTPLYIHFSGFQKFCILSIVNFGVRNQTIHLRYKNTFEMINLVLGNSRREADKYYAPLKPSEILVIYHDFICSFDSESSVRQAEASLISNAVTIENLHDSRVYHYQRWHRRSAWVCFAGFRTNDAQRIRQSYLMSCNTLRAVFVCQRN